MSTQPNIAVITCDNTSHVKSSIGQFCLIATSVAALLQGCATAPQATAFAPREQLGVARAPASIDRIVPQPVSWTPPPRPQPLGRAQAAALDISMKPVTEADQAPPRLQPAVFVRPEAARPQVLDAGPARGAASPDIFGSVALAAGHTPEDAKWRRVVDYIPSPGAGPWAPLLESARAMSPMGRLEAVNAWVNRRIVWTSDEANFGARDYWGTAQESLTRGRGDCKDYAIAKMELLRALGVPADDLYFVVVKDLVRREDHALLAVRLDGRFLILDSGVDAVMDSGEVRDYRPILTYSAGHTWIHGFRKTPEVIMASAADQPSTPPSPALQ